MIKENYFLCPNESIFDFQKIMRSYFVTCCLQNKIIPGDKRFRNSIHAFEKIRLGYLAWLIAISEQQYQSSSSINFNDIKLHERAETLQNLFYLAIDKEMHALTKAKGKIKNYPKYKTILKNACTRDLVSLFQNKNNKKLECILVPEYWIPVSMVPNLLTECLPILDNLLKITVNDCLPSYPSKRIDDFSELIYNSVVNFIEKNGSAPTEIQIWNDLIQNPQPNYSIKAVENSEKRIEIIIVEGKKYSFEAFSKRWYRYTKPKDNKRH